MVNELIKERFMSHTIVGDDCWLWQGTVDVYGYGKMGIGPKKVAAHRLSWEIKNGQIPIDMCVMHKCDNKLCVNPNHLCIGTIKENIADREAKGRTARGDVIALSKRLSRSKVVEIRSKAKDGSVTFRQLAKEYGLTFKAIANMCNMRTWKNVA